jgi:hypothetical protein
MQHLMQYKFVDYELAVNLCYMSNVCREIKPMVVLSGLPFSCCAATRNMIGLSKKSQNDQRG